MITATNHIRETLATIARKKLKYFVESDGEKNKNDDLEYITA